MMQILLVYILSYPLSCADESGIRKIQICKAQSQYFPHDNSEIQLTNNQPVPLKDRVFIMAYNDWKWICRSTNETFINGECRY